MSDCSTLELFSSDFVAIDGYEFAPNEFVNSLACVALETLSTESGHKDFIAVGTTIDRGEDLAVKGATYVFEIVEVVPDPVSDMKRSFMLRLRCRDEAKGPVTAVCGIGGYIVSSMGQRSLCVPLTSTSCLSFRDVMPQRINAPSTVHRHLFWCLWAVTSWACWMAMLHVMCTWCVWQAARGSLSAWTWHQWHWW